MHNKRGCKFGESTLDGHDCNLVTCSLVTAKPCLTMFLQISLLLWGFCPTFLFTRVLLDDVYVSTVNG